MVAYASKPADEELTQDMHIKPLSAITSIVKLTNNKLQASNYFPTNTGWWRTKAPEMGNQPGKFMLIPRQ